MRGKSPTCRKENYEQPQVFDLSVDQLGARPWRKDRLERPVQRLAAHPSRKAANGL